MKLLANRLFYKSYLSISILIFKVIIFFYKKKILYIVDIDNTVGDSWPTLNQKFPSEIKRLRSIPVFKGMINYLKAIKKDNLNKIIFLSARNIKYYPITYSWLIKSGLRSSPLFLYLLFKPDDKIHFYKILLEKKINFTIIDDLSYNHEKGKILFYSEVISFINQNKINHIDFNKIQQINNDFNNAEIS